MHTCVTGLRETAGTTPVHIGYVYMTENDCQQFGLTGFKCYKDVVAAISEYYRRRG